MADYYSVVWCENPRVVTTVSKDVRGKLSYLDRLKSVNLSVRARRVVRALRNPDHINLKLGTLQSADIDSQLEVTPYLVGKRVEDLTQEERKDLQHPINLQRGDGEVCVYDAGGLYICFTGAATIASLFILDNPESWSVRHDIPYSMGYEECHFCSLYDLRGVFLCEMHMNVESHGFVLYITDEYITVYNTYGGLLDYYITRFDRKGWVDNLISFFSQDAETQYETYHIGWGLLEADTKSVLGRPRKVTFQNIHIGRIL